MRSIQIFIILLLSVSIRAQDVEFIAEASPDVLRVGDQFNLIYTSNQELEKFDMPEIRDFELLGGPSQGHSRSVSSVNGKTTTIMTYQFTYFFRAIKEGKFSIPPASIKVKNKEYLSNAVNLEVLKANSPSSNPNQGTASGAGANQTGQISENDLYVRLIVDKTEAYLGEQIMATIKIFTKTSLARIEGFKGPDFTGFFTDEVETPPLRNLKKEAVNGDIYGTGVIQRVVIIPQKSGELTIQPFDLDVVIRREIRRRYADPFFDDFSIPDIQEIPVKLKSRPLRINVKPMPPNAPASFNGAVGDFRLITTLNKTVTATNDPLTLRVAIDGKGNLKLISDVTVNVPYDMERYDPVINTKLQNALSGSKTFEYMIMPRLAGQFTIPPVEFTYFDPVTEQYKTLKSRSYDIVVERGSGDSLMAMSNGINKEDVKLLNQDIRFIKTKLPGLNYMNRYIALSPWYYVLYVLALALFIIILLIRKKFMKQNADIAGMRLRRADNYARKRLRKSEALLKQGNSSAFFEEMLGALWGYMSHKLNIPVSSLSKDSARISLQQRSVTDELTDQLFRIIDICEMARYGHGTEEINKEQLYQDALRVITTLQQKLK